MRGGCLLRGMLWRSTLLVLPTGNTKNQRRQFFSTCSTGPMAWRRPSPATPTPPFQCLPRCGHCAIDVPTPNSRGTLQIKWDDTTLHLFLRTRSDPPPSRWCGRRRFRSAVRTTSSRRGRRNTPSASPHSRSSWRRQRSGGGAWSGRPWGTRGPLRWWTPSWRGWCLWWRRWWLVAGRRRGGWGWACRERRRLRWCGMEGTGVPPGPARITNLLHY